MIIARRIAGPTPSSAGEMPVVEYNLTVLNCAFDHRMNADLPSHRPNGDDREPAHRQGSKTYAVVIGTIAKPDERPESCDRRCRCACANFGNAASRA
jgi:hypothetical protein